MKLLIPILILFACSLANAQVVINEYSCSNISTIADNFGNYEDWIELYNPGATPVDISGYYFSDKATNPTKFQVPAGVSVPANGYLKVFCSSKDQFSGGNLHTNFKLTQTKPESIVFTHSSGVILENYALVPTHTNNSRGRTTNGGPTWGVFTTPSPGASNSGALQEYATTPSFSQNAGYYPGPINVSITSPDIGVTIRYTLNGYEPTAASAAYTVPIVVNATEVIRAKAFSSNPAIPPSLISSNTYIINENHTIATISVFGDDVENLFNGAYIDADAGLEYFDKSNILRAEATGTTNKHGNDSWAYDQRGIDFVAKDQYGMKYALLYKIFNYQPRQEFQRIIIKALANDNYIGEIDGAHIRDPYVHTLVQRGGLHLDVRTYEPCVVYCNGQYWGVYDLREKVDDADFTDYYFNSGEDDVQMLKTWGGTWSEYGGAQAQTDWDNLSNFILSNDMSIPANYDYVDNLYNTKSLVDYFVLNAYVVCSDWLNWNTEWWRGINPNATHKKWRYCLWDEDATFGHYINYTGVPEISPAADPCNPENLGDPGGQGHVPILNALMNNPTFYQYYVARYADLSNTVFSCTNMQFVLDSLFNLFTPEMPNQIAKWGGNLAQWQANVQYLKDFIDDRCAQLSQGMIDCYSLSVPYPVTFDVTPPNSGTIKVNSIWVPTYPWNATYYGGMLTLMKAKANAGWLFDYWELVDPVSPGTTLDSVSTTFTQSQNVIAHFKTAVPQINLTITGTNPPCHGDQLGSATVTATDGTSASGTYTYLWSNGNTTTSIVNVAPGYYSVTVTDDIGTTATIGITIVEPAIIELTGSPDLLGCNGVQATLYATVSGGTPPYTYYWNGVSSPFSTLSVSPTSSTTYVVSVTDINNCPGDDDTINVLVSPPVVINATANCDNICSGNPVLINAYIAQGDGGPYSVYYNNNLVTLPLVLNPTVNTDVIIKAVDGCGSYALDTVSIHVLPTPVIDFSSDYNSGCSPLSVCFNNYTVPQPQGQIYTWNFGDNDMNNLSHDLHPTHIYDNEGTFSVSLTVKTPEGCIISHTIDSLVTIFPKPAARFIADPEITSIIEPVIAFENLSVAAAWYRWTFGDGDSSTAVNPLHTYNRTGDFRITLAAISDMGCRDTVSGLVKVKDEFTLYAPSAFSPDGDNINDRFSVFGNGLDKNNFRLQIYNRFGEIVFETTDPFAPWDGTYKGFYVLTGTYNWLVTYLDSNGNEHQETGAVTVIR